MTAQCLRQNIWRGTCRQCCLLVGIKRSNDQHGRCRGLYTLGAVGTGNSRECLTPSRAVNSNCATSPEEITTKGIITRRNIGTWRFPGGEVESRRYLPEVPVCMDLGHPYYYLTILLVGLTLLKSLR